MNIAIVLSGGAGSRFGGQVPKQYLEMAGKPVAVYTLEQFQRCERVEHILVVAEQCWEKELLLWRGRYGLDKLREIAPAGLDRQHSILNGLLAAEKYAAEEDTGVIIQDAARPLTSPALIDRLIAGLAKAPAVLPVIPVTDTVYYTANGQQVDGIPDRETLRAGQAPEAFRFWAYWELYKNTPPEKRGAMSGSCQLPYSAGWRVKLVPGERENIKLTYQADWKLCELILKERQGKG